MPVSIQQSLTVSPVLPVPALLELRHLMNTVIKGAFPQQSDLHIVFVESPGNDRAAYHLELPPGITEEDARALAVRVTETTLQLIKGLAIDLGVPTQQSGMPTRRVLQLPGLTRYRARCRLIKFLSLLESPPATHFVSILTDLRLRVTMGHPLGVTKAANAAYLCSAIVHRKSTRSGETVRIRSAGKLLSIIVSSEVRASAIKDGAVMHTRPIVGLIPRRLIQVEHCQRSLF